MEDPNMLCRVSCESCHVSPIWTDDPASFVGGVCLRPRRCRAQLVDEVLSRPVASKSDADVIDAVVTCLSS
jgi:hypothetical protein